MDGTDLAVVAVWGFGLRIRGFEALAGSVVALLVVLAAGHAAGLAASVDFWLLSLTWAELTHLTR